MRYTVEWLQKADDLLAKIWMAASDQQGVTDAANQIDPLLARDPSGQGTEFYGDWLMVVGPLHVVYSVDDDKRLVTVLHLWSV